MEVICEHIKSIRKPYKNDAMYLDVMEYGYEMEMTMNQMRKILNRKIGKSIKNVKVYPDNWRKHRETIITFRYKDLYCKIGEYYSGERKYIWLDMSLIL